MAGDTLQSVFSLHVTYLRSNFVRFTLRMTYRRIACNIQGWLASLDGVVFLFRDFF